MRRFVVRPKLVSKGVTSGMRISRSVSLSIFKVAPGFGLSNENSCRPPPAAKAVSYMPAYGTPGGVPYKDATCVTSVGSYVRQFLRVLFEDVVHASLAPLNCCHGVSFSETLEELLSH